MCHCPSLRPRLRPIPHTLVAGRSTPLQPPTHHLAIDRLRCSSGSLPTRLYYLLYSLYWLYHHKHPCDGIEPVRCSRGGKEKYRSRCCTDAVFCFQLLRCCLLLIIHDFSDCCSAFNCTKAVFCFQGQEQVRHRDIFMTCYKKQSCLAREVHICNIQKVRCSKKFMHASLLPA